VNGAADELCRRFGVERPIFQAGMGWVSTGRLAAAVSAAGGLGVIATGGVMPSEQLREHIARVRDEAPGRPFGVNVLLPAGADDAIGFANQRLMREQLDTCLRERVPVVVSGLGDPSGVIGEIHSAGSLFVAVVGSTRAAVKVAGAGADAVVVQGREAGGHVGRTGTLPLAQAVVHRVEIPVLLAGGIATVDGVRAALALGAGGVSVGTRFLASVESDAHDRYKQAVVDAGEGATIVSRACTGKPSRALRNRFTESWEGRDEEIAPYPQQAIAEVWRGRAGSVDGDLDEGFLPMGQGAALVEEVLAAGEIVDRLAAGVGG
jgi:enoyl-[acyl-carrier protein] reductase II